MRARSQKAQFSLRIYEPLRAKLEVAAKRNGVSLNAEITRRLEDSLRGDAMASLEARLDKLERHDWMK